MFLIFALLLIVLPIAEIALLLKVGAGFGLANTLGFVIFTAVLGAYLVRQQGISTLIRVRQEADAGRMPATEMAEGVLLLISGAVLLTPGFITDAMGFALLIPVVRRSLIAWVAANSLKATANGSSSGFIFTAHRSTHSSSSPSHSDQRNTNKTTKPKENVILEGRYRDSD
jgi:UPF0716 protein FxsA